MADGDSAHLEARQGAATVAFVELVNALLGEFDVIDLLTGLTARCVELLRADAAGILLADNHRTLRVIGASSEEAYLLELFQLQNDEGPCLDCYQTGQVISRGDLSGETPWPQFAAASVASGYQSVCAIPMRIRDTTTGCVNLFMSENTVLGPADIALARGLADVATIAIAQNQRAEDAVTREAQLQHALDSRTIIEQAKGMVAAQTGVDMHDAFSWLRNQARSNNWLLTDVAHDVVRGVLVAPPRFATTPQHKPPPPPRPH